MLVIQLISSNTKFSNLQISTNPNSSDPNCPTLQFAHLNSLYILLHKSLLINYSSSKIFAPRAQATVPKIAAESLLYRIPAKSDENPARETLPRGR